MTAERIAVIISEIKYWKEHRLLPETYCDYLLALYTNGEDVKDEDHLDHPKRLSPAIMLHLILAISLLPFSFLVLYFTQFHPFLQLGILLLFSIYSIWFYWYTARNGYELFFFPMLILLLQLFLLTITAANLFTDRNIIMLAVIITNFFFWFRIGKTKHIKFLQILSILCIISTVLYIIF